MFSGRAEFVYFPSKVEEEFDISDLNRLDAFLVWTPAITINTVNHLLNCKILVRYGVGFDKIDL